MRLFAYMTTLLMLVGAGIMATEYGYTAQIAGLDAPNQQPGMLGYPVAYSENGKVMSSAFMNGQPRSFLYDHVDDLETLPGPKAPVTKPAVSHSSSAATSSSNRTVVHSSSNVCRSTRSCTPVYRSGSTTCGTVYYYPRTYSSCNNVCYNSCGYRTWNYRPCQPVRNVVRFFHNRRPVRSCLRRVFCGRCW